MAGQKHLEGLGVFPRHPPTQSVGDKPRFLRGGHLAIPEHPGIKTEAPVKPDSAWKVIKPLKRLSLRRNIILTHDFPIPKGSLRERDAYGKVMG